MSGPSLPIRRNPDPGRPGARGIRCTPRPRGFGLLELVIVLGLVGLLAGIVWPAYGKVAADARRREAQAVMLQAAAHLETLRNASGRFSAGTELPSTLARSPANGPVHYVLSVRLAADGVGFVVRAVPEGPAVADPCGTLGLSSTGQRTCAPGQALHRCWR